MLSAVMRVLFAILLIALAGLLWATTAAARHVREARRRQRNVVDRSAGRPSSREEALLDLRSAPAPADLPSKRILRPKPVQSYF